MTSFGVIVSMFSFVFVLFRFIRSFFCYFRALCLPWCGQFNSFTSKMNNIWQQKSNKYVIMATTEMMREASHIFISSSFASSIFLSSNEVSSGHSIEAIASTKRKLDGSMKLPSSEIEEFLTIFGRIHCLSLHDVESRFNFSFGIASSRSHWIGSSLRCGIFVDCLYVRRLQNRFRTSSNFHI